MELKFSDFDIQEFNINRELIKRCDKLERKVKYLQSKLDKLTYHIKKNDNIVEVRFINSSFDDVEKMFNFLKNKR